MTQGMQNTLCYIREVNNSNSYNAFLSDHGIPQGWKQFPDIYLLFANIQHTRRLCRWGFFILHVVLVWIFFFNGPVAIKSLAVFDTQHSVIVHLLHVKQEAPNRICSQLEVPSSTDGMSVNLFIGKALEMQSLRKYWHQQSLLPGRCLKHSLANQAGVTRGWIICKNSCSTAPL